jgi:hypoxanthine phosphoribosyltransferase
MPTGSWELEMEDIHVLIGETEIAVRVETLAAEIAQRVTGEFVLVGMLKGAAMLVADLARALFRTGARPEIEFMRLSSYGLGKQSSGEVHLLGDIPTELAGRRVLLVDDMVDTGRSITYAAALLRQRGVGELWTCALLDKPRRREIAVEVDFVGFTIEDVFVAGYGVDYAEKYRYLPYIGIVR